MAIAVRHGDVAARRREQLEARRAREQPHHARRHRLEPEQPEGGAGVKGALGAAVAQGRRRAQRLLQRRRADRGARARADAGAARSRRQPRGLGAVEILGQHRPQPAARREIEDRARIELARAPVLALQRQPQQQLLQWQLALDGVRDGVLEPVEDDVARLLRDRRGVVAERRTRVAVLHEVLAVAGEGLPARHAGDPGGGLGQVRRPGRQHHDRLARTGRGPRLQDAQPGLQIVQALLGRQQTEERDQAIDRAEADRDLPAGDHPAPVDRETRQVEPHLPERHSLEHDPSIPHLGRVGAMRFGPRASGLGGNSDPVPSPAADHGRGDMTPSIRPEARGPRPERVSVAAASVRI